MSALLRCTVLGACLCASTAAWASPVEFYGFGARRMGRGGGGTAIADGAESVEGNPAAIAGIEVPDLMVGYMMGDARFAPVPELWWDTNRDGLVNEADAPLSASPTYDRTHGALLGAAVPFGPRVAVGIALYLPPGRLLRLSTIDPQIPNYIFYANRQQRYELALGLGVRAWRGLGLGVGYEMIPATRFKLVGTIGLKLDDPESGTGTEPAEVSELVTTDLDVHAMSLDIIPNGAPTVGLHWDLGELTPALDGLAIGGTWRGEAGLPVDVDIDLQINAGTEEIGDLGPVLLPFLLGVQLGVYDHYLPRQVNLGAAWTFRDRFLLSADIRRTAWDRMQLNIAEVYGSELAGAGIDLGENPIADGNPYTVVLVPTWSPRVGGELRFDVAEGEKLGPIRAIVRGGFGYEPSPLAGQGAGTALLDADRLIFSGGLGLEHLDPIRRASPRRVRWDGFFQIHRLASGELARVNPGGPTAGYTIDGSPVPIGGHLLTAGVQGSFDY